jgi:prepilin-type N-terminal cleavage/methylation domain-containing protein
MKPEHTLTDEHGVTLTELMVVLLIVAVLAAVAIPSFSRDSEEHDFERYVHTIAQDIRLAHHQAMSSREDYRLMINGSGYEVHALVNNVPSLVARRPAPNRVVVADVRNYSTMSWNTGYGVPAAATTLASNKELRFFGLGNMQVDVGGGLTDDSATIFLRSTGAKQLQARIVVFPATSKPTLLQKW